jgi:hypothetical protein
MTKPQRITDARTWALGAAVEVADGIVGIVDELIFARGYQEPLVLVEYWHEGERRHLRFLWQDVHFPDGEPF